MSTSLKALVKRWIVMAFFLVLNRFASGCLGKNVERRDQSSLRITGKRRVADAHGKIRSPVLHSDPRRAGSFQAAAVSLTAERPGKFRKNLSFL